jgi:NAD(P)-dependent dehydrogenase (short-subunit alcohol dehydrogenase family)
MVIECTHMFQTLKQSASLRSRIATSNLTCDPPDFSDKAIDAYYDGKTALPRTGTPDDVAGTVLHLSSDAADWVTGTVSVLDGGLLAGY